MGGPRGAREILGAWFCRPSAEAARRLVKGNLGREKGQARSCPARLTPGDLVVGAFLAARPGTDWRKAEWVAGDALLAAPKQEVRREGER